MIVRHVVVTLLYCSYVLKMPKLTFYPALIKSIIIFGFVYMLFELRKFAVINPGLIFMLVCAGAGIIGHLVVLILLFNKDERKRVLAKGEIMLGQTA